MTFNLTIYCDHPGCEEWHLVCDQLEEALGHNPPEDTPTKLVIARLLRRGMVLMESPERSIGTIERVIHNPGAIHVELLDGGSERYAPTTEVLVRPEARADVVFDTGWMALPRGWRWRETDTERRGTLCPTHAPTPTT